MTGYYAATGQVRFGNHHIEALSVLRRTLALGCFYGEMKACHNLDIKLNSKSLDFNFVQGLTFKEYI